MSTPQPTWDQVPAPGTGGRREVPPPRRRIGPTRPVVLRIVGLDDQPRATSYDGQWVVEYDPSQVGMSPTGQPMIYHLRTTANLSEALRFDSYVDAVQLWRRKSGHQRSDPLLDMPLTAFHCRMELVNAAGRIDPFDSIELSRKMFHTMSEE